MNGFHAEVKLARQQAKRCAFAELCDRESKVCVVCVRGVCDRKSKVVPKVMVQQASKKAAKG